MNAERIMPIYQSHKKVYALKIASIGINHDGSATIVSEEPGYGGIEVSSAYVSKHEPKAGGYYVVYEDGYKSWSPAEAFESGYSRVD